MNVSPRRIENYTPAKPHCDEPCEHGGACTLNDDHEGAHEAWGGRKILHCTWPRTCAPWADGDAPF